MKLGRKRAELGQKFVPRSRFRMFRNERTNPPYQTLKSCFCAFRTIWVHLGKFGCLTKLDAKRAELVQNFLPRSLVGIFRNERTRSTLLYPILMFWCISYHLGSFGTVWLPFKTHCKTGRTSAQVRAMKWCRNVLQRTHPIQPIAPQTHILVRFIPFGCIWGRLVALRISLQNGPN
jgi:hypothetical protein